MENKHLEYKVPEDSNVECSSYFKSNPVKSWSAAGFIHYRKSQDPFLKKYGKLNEEFYNDLSKIQRSQETPEEVNRIILSLNKTVSAI